MPRNHQPLRYLLCSLLLLLASLPARAQGPANAPPPANVSGTILDPTGVPYNTGYIRFDLVPAGGPVPCVGTPCTSINGHYGNVYLDSNGHFQMNLYPNSLITPANTQWQITVSEPGDPAPWCFGPQSFTTAVTIPNSATVDLSATLSALAPQLCRNGSSTSNINIYHNGTLVGVEPGVNIVDTGTVVATVVDHPGSHYVSVQNAASGGGSGCVPPGVSLNGVLFEHPLGNCTDSLDWTWDDGVGAQNELHGDGSNALHGTNSLTFTHGSGNSLTDISQAWADGVGNTFTCDSNTLGSNCELFYTASQNGVISITGASSNGFNIYDFSRGSSTTAATGASLSYYMTLLGGNTALTNTGGNIDVVLAVGQNHSVQSLGAGSITSSEYIIGETNSALSSNGGNVEDNVILGENDVAQSAQSGALVGFGLIAGYNNTMKSGGASVQVNYGVELGHLNKIGPSGNGATATMTDFGMFGHSLLLENCTDCFAIGKNIDGTTSNTLYLGMSILPGLTITNSGGSNDNVRRSPLTFGSLPACASGTEGSYAAITDSSTATAGATITGSGTHHVMGYCNGTNWQVVVGI